nr:leucyl aminopeptidase [uncultured Actinoplanes sp.]
MSGNGQVFDVVPSTRRTVVVTTVPIGDLPSEVEAVAIPVATDGDVPVELGCDRPALTRSGFTAEIGEVLAVPVMKGAALVAMGIGATGSLDPAGLRRAAAAFARAVPADGRIACWVPSGPGLPAADAAAAMVEGMLLARYRFDMRSSPRGPAPITELVLATGDREEQVRAGAERGLIVANAALLGRDLANCPADDLTASRMAEVAIEVGARSGLRVETFDRDALVALGCGGLLGVNRGSVEPPRMIRLRYLPDDPTGRLTLVGKGVMYDSGGINLKPSDASHSTMKNDMSGAGAVLSAMSALRDLGCRTAVTGYLMCTDNMPSGSALRMGDVLTIRGGTTVEVLNTDAEGRLVMADALVLAREEPVDAIVDMATLTGACLRTFGTEVAGLMGNDDSMIGQVQAAAATTDERVWQLPLDRRQRHQLDSEIADITNMGGINAGSITAALFLAEFVGSVPWAHVDIAGTAWSDSAQGWLNKGATGYGTRLLIELAMRFAVPAGATAREAAR